MAVKVGINGFGRIGRNVVRAGLHNKDIEFVAVNDLTDTKTLAHLLKYDSVLGPLPETVTHDENSITVGGKTIKVFKIKDPAELDWTSVGAQIVIESTGFFTDGKDASKHIKGSVKKVIISAPAKNEDVTLVLGDEALDPRGDVGIENCLEPRARLRVGKDDPPQRASVNATGVGFGVAGRAHRRSELPDHLLGPLGEHFVAELVGIHDPESAGGKRGGRGPLPRAVPAGQSDHNQ